MERKAELNKKREAIKRQAQLKKTKREQEEANRELEESLRKASHASDTEGLTFKAVATKDESGARVVSDFPVREYY